MKRIFTILAITFLSANSFGQGVEQGNVIIDPYYGFPNFGKSFTDLASEGIDNVTVRGYGPAGLRVEYMVGDQFGIGVDAIFNGFSVEGTSTDSIYNGTTMQYEAGETNSAKTSMNRVRIQARFNYHFNVTSDDLDVYMGLGAGTNNRFYKLVENGVETEDDSAELTLIPFSLRVAAGMRYYFTDNIGLNAEIGIGGPVLSAGISIKF